MKARFNEMLDSTETAQTTGFVNKHTGIGSGVLLIDKPPGRTSFSVINEIKRLLKPSKIGHCGTLDPFATGLLLVCINEATRIADQFLFQDKSYEFTVRFGFHSDTLDPTGNIVRTYSGPAISLRSLEEAAASLEGTILQEVPSYAAVKVNGRRLYELTRNGIKVDRPKREVTIYELNLLEFGWPDARFSVRCSKGTYIRQIAADLGMMLSCDAYVESLRRTASGSFTIEDAHPIDFLRTLPVPGGWEKKLIPMTDALAHLPSVFVTQTLAVKHLLHGRLDPALAQECRSAHSQNRLPVRLVEPSERRLLALWFPPSEDDGKDYRLRVFNVKSTDAVTRSM